MADRRENRLEEVAKWARATLDDALESLRLTALVERHAVPMPKPPVMTPTERDMRIAETRHRLDWIEAALAPDGKAPDTPGSA